MKKSSIIVALAALALGFTGCKEEDKDPVYHQPSESYTFDLNTPAFANQLFELEDGNTLEFTTSQPDYGFVASVNYSMQMAVVADPADDQVYDLTTATPTSAVMVVKASDVAVGICKLNGIDSDEAWAAADKGPRSVWFRAVAAIPGHVEESTVYSNWIEMKAIKPYFAVPTPGYIYLIGQCSGWKEPAEQNAADLADWRLFEKNDNIGSKIYSGVFNVPAGQAMFRFYTQLSGWDGGDSWGIQEEDNAVDVEFTDGKFSGDIVNGKGSWNFADWAGGEMTIIADFASATPKITVIAGAAEVIDPTYIYMVGNNAGWAEPGEVNEDVYNNWRLVDDNGDGIFSATFALENIPDDTLYCRFYQALNGWGKAQWSADPDDGVNVECTSGQNYPTVIGEGCFMVGGVNGHNVTVTLDINTNTVRFDVE